MSILWAIVIGFIAGVIAKFIMPGDNEPAGFIQRPSSGSLVLSLRLTLGKPLAGIVLAKEQG